MRAAAAVADQRAPITCPGAVNTSKAFSACNAYEARATRSIVTRDVLSVARTTLSLRLCQQARIIAFYSNIAMQQR